MKPIILLLLLLSEVGYALPVLRQVNDIVRYQEQKNIYEQKQEEQVGEAPVYTELKQIPLLQNSDTASPCIQIDFIDTKEITLIDSEVLEGLTQAYSGKCNKISDLNILVKKINNIYIEKAYITSMAYIKPQDLSQGKLTISALESKIGAVKGENVSVLLIAPFMTERYLNLRDLEVSIEQLNRLKSKQVTMSIDPGEGVGYSQVVMKGTKKAFPLHGTLGANNYGTSKSGKFQFTASLGWDDPLGINDLLSVHLNTTNKQDNENNSLGNSISYAFPVGRSYLEFSYAKFNYDQIVEGLFVDYNSRGESDNFQTKFEYKLFHTKNQRAKLDLSLIRKKNDNYLQDVYLESSSNTLTIFQLAYTHNYIGKTWDGYISLKYNQGLPWFAAHAPKIYDLTFSKYTLDLSYNKKLEGKGLAAIYNFSFYGQYADENIVASEQIGIGGPYSVRGFSSEDQISGNKGFYIRNELAFPVALKESSFTPYIGFDYGVVSHNKYSYGGDILGAVVGSRALVHGFFLDLYHSEPIYDSNEFSTRPNGDMIHKALKGFTGFSLSYLF